MSEQISISAEKYNHLVEQGIKYRFLIETLLTDSKLDKGSINFTYNADTNFTRFMKCFERSRFDVFELEHSKDNEE